MNKTLLFRVLFTLAMITMLPVLASANLTGTGIDLSSLQGLGNITGIEQINSLISNATNSGSDSLSPVSAVNDSCNDTLADDYDQKIQLISGSIDLAIDNTIANMSASTGGAIDVDPLAGLDFLA